MLTKQSQVHVKENNLRLVLATIIRHEPLCRADIVRHTGISKPAVSSLIDDLLGRGIVREIGEGQSRGGRKPILLKFNSDMRRYLAFEMGRTGYRVAVADLKGGFLGHREAFFERLSTMDDRLSVLEDSILELLRELGVRRQDLLKIICIAPGTYVERDKALEWTPNDQGCPGRDLSVFFSRVFNREILMNHSTKLSLLGEKIAGNAAGYRNVVYVDFAYGLGCAIMIDGRIYSGCQGTAGEIGYFYSSREEFRTSPVKPYQLGCLERRISGKAVRDRLGEFLDNGGGGALAELRKNDSASPAGKLVFEAYNLGDVHARTILQQAFGYFNQALCNIINLLAPEVVILGGGFSRAGKVLRDLVVREVRDRVLVMPRIEVSVLKNEASLIGGIQYLIDQTDLLSEL